MVQRKNRRGISGSLTSFILIAASVVISLVVIGFAFGTLTYTSTPTVKQDGEMLILSKGEEYCLTGVVTSSGNVIIDSVSVNGNMESISVKINQGQNNLDIPLPSSFNPQQGQHYNVILGLSDGTNLNAYAYYS
ncbi:hypothetical protein IC006_0116 [Sulfuracidifex tepidarius]|uniref:Archaeal Type IV pilin N-terminal domain-containing protein n=1 Tax=Sulfuracidifex tepidarius TaxID=1294262 RepID=A0A510DRP5_9CREN|nr:hypothetical protein [Sulfuracidifex tepidarius]BBG22832.1 hypothetical protein IC006_0116 [Sulfuracidifex tepidarius]